MGAFGIIDVAKTGVSAANSWMGAISHNLANANTRTRVGEEPFRAQKILLEADGNERGARVAGFVRDQRQAQLVFDPARPRADENGLVQLANVDIATEMSELIVASRHYQMNLRVVSSAEEAYQAALEIGRG